MAGGEVVPEGEQAPVAALNDGRGRHSRGCGLQTSDRLQLRLGSAGQPGVHRWLGQLQLGQGMHSSAAGQGTPFNGKLRDELLNAESFDTWLEARILVERWRRHDDTVRPHRSLGYRPPAPEAIQPWPPGSAIGALRREPRAVLAGTLT